MITTLLILLGFAALSVEIAYHSSLAYDIKHALGLTEDKLPKIGILSQWKFWKKFLPKYLIFLAIIPLIFFIIYYKIIELINCPYCQSAWYGFFYGIYLQKVIPEALGFAGLCVFFVYIIEIVAKHLEK